jgi:YbbR domain-containing protein
VVPLEYHNLPTSLVFVDETVDYVGVRVKQGEAFRNQSTPPQLSAVVDLSNAKAGETEYDLNETNIRAPARVDIKRIYPSVIKVKLEPVVTKRVDIVANVIGRPDQGVLLKRIEVRPSVVTIEGPRSRVDGLRQVNTVPINLAGVRRTFSQEVSLKGMGTEIRVFEDEPVVVHVILEESP